MHGEKMKIANCCLQNCLGDLIVRKMIINQSKGILQCLYSKQDDEYIQNSMAEMYLEFTTQGT